MNTDICKAIKRIFFDELDKSPISELIGMEVMKTFATLSITSVGGLKEVECWLTWITWLKYSHRCQLEPCNDQAEDWRHQATFLYTQKKTCLLIFFCSMKVWTDGIVAHYCVKKSHALVTNNVDATVWKRIHWIMKMFVRQQFNKHIDLHTNITSRLENKTTII